MTGRAWDTRCRRCGGEAEQGAFLHHVWLRDDAGPREVTLRLCGPCGRDFPGMRERDEYLRLVLLG